MLRVINDFVCDKIFFPKISLILFFFIQNIAYSQISYLMSLENASLNNNYFEFDVLIKNTETDFDLVSYQCSFTFNVGNTNNGNLSFSYIQGTSELLNKPVYGVGINSNDVTPKLVFGSTVGNDLITSSKKRVGRFRLSNTTAFSSSNFEISWCFNGSANTILIGPSYFPITSSSNHTNLVFTNEINPKLLSAVTSSLTNVVLTFSKQMDPATANNASNYSITNGININQALISQDGTKITLSTSEHSSGQNYTVTVNNLKDISGNLIDPSANSAQYICTQGDNLFLNVKVFLQGPYQNGYMNTSLLSSDFIPLSQPFNTSPWNYSGSETVSSIPADIVDWILLELRSEESSSSIVKTCAAFIRKDGLVVGLDGVSKVNITDVQSADYYVVIKHRNHLSIMSSSKVTLSGNPSLYDFTTSSNKAYGNNAQCSLGGGKYGMYSGDGNSNGTINNADANAIWKRENGNIGYYNGDFDLNVGVNIVDKNSHWKQNSGKSSQVP